jgi:hypothetical protein
MSGGKEVYQQHPHSRGGDPWRTMLRDELLRFIESREAICARRNLYPFCHIDDMYTVGMGVFGVGCRGRHTVAVIRYRHVPDMYGKTDINLN